MRRLRAYIVRIKNADGPAYEPKWCWRAQLYICAQLMRYARMEHSYSNYSNELPSMWVNMRYRGRYFQVVGVETLVIINGYTLENFTAFFSRGSYHESFIEIICTREMKERPLRRYFNRVCGRGEIILYCSPRKHYATDLAHARLAAIEMM